MVRSAVKSWWQTRLPEVSAAFARFPLAVAIAALATFYKLSQPELGEFELRVLGALAASFLWVVAVELYAESQKRSAAIRLLLWLSGLVLIALLFALAWDVWLSPPLLLGGLLLLVALSAHLERGKNNSSFWLFNHRLWLGALLALAGAVLFGAGLSAIQATLKLLFGLGLSPRWHDHIWTVSLGFIATVSFLSFVPRSFADPITVREEQDFTMRAASALVKFVLVPLLLIYTAILYAYAIKIVLAWELPKGTLAAMVVGYLFVGAATLLLGYPSRETGGTLVRFFWRNWVWLAALPVLLLFIAVSRRIADYGLTEERYMIVLVGVWALLLALIRLLRGSDFDLRFLPGVLAMLLFTASFGPGGAVGFSVMSQKAELGLILEKRGLLVERKFVTPKQGGDEPPLGRDAARARAIEWYLNTHHSLGVLAAWFEGVPNDPFAPGRKPEETARDLLVALGLRPDPGTSGNAVFFNHHSDMPATMSLAQPRQLIGPVIFKSGAARAPMERQSVKAEALGDVELDLEGHVLTARLGDGASVSFDLVGALQELKRRGWPEADDHAPIALQGAAQGLTGAMLIDGMGGSYDDRDSNFSMLRFWLLLARAP